MLISTYLIKWSLIYKYEQCIMWDGSLACCTRRWKKGLQGNNPVYVGLNYQVITFLIFMLKWGRRFLGFPTLPPFCSPPLTYLNYFLIHGRKEKGFDSLFSNLWNWIPIHCWMGALALGDLQKLKTSTNILWWPIIPTTVFFGDASPNTVNWMQCTIYNNIY